MEMVRRTRAWLHYWIPAWVPICLTIASGIFYVGQYTKGVNDHLGALDERWKSLDLRMDGQQRQLILMQDYLRNTRLLDMQASPQTEKIVQHSRKEIFPLWPDYRPYRGEESGQPQSADMQPPYAR